MSNNININYITRLPLDIIINNLIPFTYITQPRELLQDIRSFSADFSTLEQYYYSEFNENVLVIDLYNFCNRSNVYACNMNNDFGKMLRRNFRLKNKPYSYLNNYSFIHYRRDGYVMINRKIKIIWGVLNPIERTQFITMYLIRNL